MSVLQRNRSGANWIARGSLDIDGLTGPAVALVILALGFPSCGELVALNASARNYWWRFSRGAKALNKETSTLGISGGRMVERRLQGPALAARMTLSGVLP